MTTIEKRDVTADDAVTSVVGYMRRMWKQLAAEHVQEQIAKSSGCELGADNRRTR